MTAAEARAEGFRDVFRGPSEPASEGAWERFAAALDDDFNTPDALAILHEWRDHDLLRRALAIFGLESLGEEDKAPPEADELARRRQEARAARDFDAADRLREELEASGWDVRDESGGYRLVRRR
jgi:cysteinyl-tRNA synthetase